MKHSAMRKVAQLGVIRILASARLLMTPCYYKGVKHSAALSYHLDCGLLLVPTGAFCPWVMRPNGYVLRLVDMALSPCIPT